MTGDARSVRAGDPDPADRGPGASSGHESRPQERIVRGTGTAAEGYETRGAAGGTKDGDPLAGVRIDTESEADAETTAGDEGSGEPEEDPSGRA
ncbi:hypothetical protein Acsp03_05370 [Actinomadura sp. NBRC 104412]|uniref:hypothetical protein n=1 Tax=Actinomadura sp. NBRC 104412 TaxID=3032203 RepID=UPI0024A1F0EF|nr:hypothetical protein [Actinomadura sp. NBRC 104412]GLZ03070.1 hypothetical protein Acsp03_05370 [Actinomadura sp. NBRC 104412]